MAGNPGHSFSSFPATLFVIPGLTGNLIINNNNEKSTIIHCSNLYAGSL